MAYPTGMLSLKLEDIDQKMLALKTYAQRLKDESNAGTLPSTLILIVYEALRADRAQLVTAASATGMATFAQEQKGNASLDVVAEFNGVIAAIDNVTSWINSNFPKDGSGFLLAQTLGANGRVDRVFTAAATAGLRTQLDALLATIN